MSSIDVFLFIDHEQLFNLTKKAAAAMSNIIFRGPMSDKNGGWIKGHVGTHAKGHWKKANWELTH